MKTFILLFILLTGSLMAEVICCCDDSENTLLQETAEFLSLTTEAAGISSSTAGRLKIYESLMRVEDAKAFYSAKKINAANMAKDSVLIKENFELEAATAKINAARISNAESAAKTRIKIGEEAEQFVIKK